MPFALSSSTIAPIPRHSLQWSQRKPFEISHGSYLLAKQVKSADRKDAKLTACSGGSGPVGVVEEHGLELAVLQSRTAAVRMVRAVVALLALVRVAFTRATDAKYPACRCVT